MQVHRDIDHLPDFHNAVITIGTFDGVHTGHRQIFMQMKSAATGINGETVIITFHPHPRKIVKGRPGTVQLLTTMDERIALLEEIGINHLVIVPFTGEFAEMDAESYVKNFLIQKFNPHTIIIGYDHRFGKGRSGDYKLLESFAKVYGFTVKEIPEKLLNDAIISSTFIRDSLLNGDVDKAAVLLGYTYFIEALVVHGQKRGRTIGYPTANLEIPDGEKLVPTDGVYAVKVLVKESGNAEYYNGMLNIGFRPTVDGTRKVIEVNLFDFHGDLYGQKIKVFFHRFIRGEIKFAGIEQLKAQLDADKIASLSILENSYR
jgi:riboflavin kinase/FMN adenylyltransferase